MEQPVFNFQASQPNLFYPNVNQQQQAISQQRRHSTSSSTSGQPQPSGSNNNNSESRNRSRQNSSSINDQPGLYTPYSNTNQGSFYDPNTSRITKSNTFPEGSNHINSSIKEEPSDVRKSTNETGKIDEDEEFSTANPKPKNNDSKNEEMKKSQNNLNNQVILILNLT